MNKVKESAAFPEEHMEHVIIDSLISDTSDGESEHRLAVIVPVYNCAQYIEECLTSIVNQDFTDYEIIIVDDGSTDESTDICRRFAELHKDNERFAVKYVKQKNRGLSNARNLGLDYVNSKYVKFLDSDDMFASDALSECISVAEENGLDVLLSGIEAFIDPGAASDSVKNKKMSKYYNGYRDNQNGIPAQYRSQIRRNHS